MDIYEAVKTRRSVRDYNRCALTDDDIDMLIDEIAYINYKGNLNVQLRLDEPQTFVGGFASYGNIKGARNYIAMVGPKGKTIDERLGYYGERLVLAAQMRGISSVWLGLTYNKGKMGAVVDKGDVCPLVIAIGYSDMGSGPRKVKPLERFAKVKGNPMKSTDGLPQWFVSGLEMVQLAPSAMNQQRYVFDLVDGDQGMSVRATTKMGPYTKTDLGIARYHFEIGANRYSNDWIWV